MLRGFTFFAAIVFIVSFDAVAGTPRPLTVVELFTSQGCSSCPPADAHLGELTRLDENERVLALSYHVDYWNNLGWPDPYSSAENTRRQRAYARHMELRYVYTPQMVVQGTLQATGSDRRAIQRHVEATRKLPRIAVGLLRDGATLKVSIAASQTPMQADIIMVVFDREHVTKVRRGENSGKTISNYNVVRSMTRIAGWNGQSATLSAPIGDNGDACAVLVQSKQSGKILGAASIALN